MKKRFLTAALTVALSLSTVCSVKAATTVDIRYNNWDMPLTGYLKDGTTYVPIRQFFQLLGGSWVTWNSTELSANVRGNANAAFYLGSRIAWIDSEKHQLPGRCYSQNGTFPEGTVFFITLGGVAQFVQYSRKFAGPINEFANILHELQSAFSAAERVFRILDDDRCSQK